MLQTNMLQNDRTHALLDGIMPPEQSGDSGLGELANFALGFLRRQYLVIIFTAALALAASVIYLRITPPTYTAQVKVLFGNPKGQFVQQQSLLAEPAIDVTQLESQIQILQSKAIATSVINQLRLADDPDFEDSSRSLRSVWQAIRGWLGSTPPDRRIERQDRPTDRLVAEFDKRLSATRLGYSTVIEISFSASNAERAAEIANAVANAYVTDQVNAKLEANRAATAWLQDRLRELGQQALTAEREVNAFKSQNNIVAAGGKLMDEQQVAELTTRLGAVRAQTSEALARLNRFEKILASKSIGDLDAPGSDAQNNAVINHLRQQYLEYATREFEYSTKYGPDHLAVVALRTTMKGIRASILDEVRQLAAISRSDFEVAKQRQQEIEKQLAVAVSQSRTTNSADLRIRELETSAKEYRALHESFLQRYMGSLQHESFPVSSEARVISPATPPQSKSKPRPGLVLALGMLGGIALGAALGFLRDILDRAFRTSAQIEATLQLPCLSLVPLLRDRELEELSRRGAVQDDKKFGQRTLCGGSGMYWAATAMPSSRFAESIRSIKVAIDLDSTKTPNKIIGITSTLPDEGKSTIAASLAQLLAQAGKQVIVVDCDLRNPSLSAKFAPNAGAGIIEVLAGARSLEETVWKDPKTNLAFLPVAKRAPLFQSSEILSAEQTKRLFNDLRATYDCVIVDFPPLAPIVDVRATTPLIDCFILVVEWGRTTTDDVQHALHAAPNVYEAVVGTVLNKTDMKAMKRYANYHGEYYNKEHYIRYSRLMADENA